MSRSLTSLETRYLPSTDEHAHQQSFLCTSPIRPPRTTDRPQAVLQSEVERDRRTAQNAQMTGAGQHASPASPQQPWLAKLPPLLTLLFTGTVSTLIAQHVIDRVRVAQRVHAQPVPHVQTADRAKTPPRHRCLPCKGEAAAAQKAIARQVSKISLDHYGSGMPRERRTSPTTRCSIWR